MCVAKGLKPKEKPYKIRFLYLKQIIFVFWGNNAKSKEALVTNPNHVVLKAPHPSPLSAYHGFFGCKHFSMINDILDKNGLEEINWQI